MHCRQTSLSLRLRLTRGVTQRKLVNSEWPAHFPGGGDFCPIILELGQSCVNSIELRRRYASFSCSAKIFIEEVFDLNLGDKS
jgi:hypothetical protein